MKSIDKLTSRDLSHVAYSYSVRGAGNPELHAAIEKRLESKTAVVMAKPATLKAKLADYVMLAKLRLSFSVVFSAGAGYLLNEMKLHPKRFVHFSLFGKKDKGYNPEEEK